MSNESINQRIRAEAGRSLVDDEESRQMLDKLQANASRDAETEPDPGHGGHGSADAGARSERIRESDMNAWIRSETGRGPYYTGS